MQVPLPQSSYSRRNKTVLEATAENNCLIPKMSGNYVLFPLFFVLFFPFQYPSGFASQLQINAAFGAVIWTRLHNGELFTLRKAQLNLSLKVFHSRQLLFVDSVPIHCLVFIFNSTFFILFINFFPYIIRFCCSSIRSVLSSANFLNFTSGLLVILFETRSCYTLFSLRPYRAARYAGGKGKQNRATQASSFSEF